MRPLCKQEDCDRDCLSCDGTGLDLTAEPDLLDSPEDLEADRRWMCALYRCRMGHALDSLRGTWVPVRRWKPKPADPPVQLEMFQ